MPIFSFGRGSAKIASSQAKAYAAKTYIDIERKNDEVAETEIINVIHSSQQIREDVFNSYIDTKTQRKIIKDRLEIVSFAAEAYIDSGLRELILLERLISFDSVSCGSGIFLFCGSGIFFFISGLFILDVCNNVLKKITNNKAKFIKVAPLVFNVG